LPNFSRKKEISNDKLIIHHSLLFTIQTNNSMSSQTNPSPQNNSIQTTPSQTNSESSGDNSNTNVSKDEIVSLRVKDVVVDKNHLVRTKICRRQQATRISELRFKEQHNFC